MREREGEREGGGCTRYTRIIRTSEEEKEPKKKRERDKEFVSCFQAINSHHNCLPTSKQRTDETMCGDKGNTLSQKKETERQEQHNNKAKKKKLRTSKAHMKDEEVVNDIHGVGTLFPFFVCLSVSSLAYWMFFQ